MVSYMKIDETDCVEERVCNSRCSHAGAARIRKPIKHARQLAFILNFQ
jgi:hypothetical protein